MVEHIQKLIQYGYTKTIVIYPFKKILSVIQSHIMSMGGGETDSWQRFSVSCTIYNGRIVEVYFYEMMSIWFKNFPRSEEKEKEQRGLLCWDKAEFSKPYHMRMVKQALEIRDSENKKVYKEGNRSKSEMKKESVQKIKKEDFLLVKNYMAELYKLYQKKDMHSENEEKNRILLEKSFSKALKKAITGKLDHKTSYANEESSSFSLETGSRLYENHYVVVVPTDWFDGVAEDILRLIFTNAGLITEYNPPCRLIFVDELHAIFYSFQRCLSGPNSKYWLEYGTLKENRHYALFKVDYNSYSDEASVDCFLFQTGNANSTINGMKGLKPYDVVKFGKIDLVSINDMKKCLLGLLRKNRIITLETEYLRLQKELKKNRG